MTKGGFKVPPELLIQQWLVNDSQRMQALHIAGSCNLPDWCLAAGFVRNLVWDQLHGYPQPTPLNDFDFIYFSIIKFLINSF